MEKATRILQNIMTFLFQIGALASAIILIILGLKYAFSYKKGEELRKLLIYVILGLVLLFLAFVIPQIINAFLSKYVK
jgi:multisubunit Na+/H+ antiporter MnhB subunit